MNVIHRCVRCFCDLASLTSSVASLLMVFNHFPLHHPAVYSAFMSSSMDIWIALHGSFVAKTRVLVTGGVECIASRQQITVMELVLMMMAGIMGGPGLESIFAWHRSFLG